MTKKEIDTYFTENWNDIQKVVRDNQPKSKSKNKQDISSILYEICIEKKDEIKCLPSFLRITAANQYRWMNSDHNKENRVPESNDIGDNYTYNCEEVLTIDEEYQELQYALALYYREASPSERALHDLFVKEGLRTVRQMRERLSTSQYGAHQLLKEFKTKIKSYER